MPLVSITRLRVRSVRYLPGFLWRTFVSARQARAAPGNLDVALLNDANRTFWTRSVWTDKAAMRAFMMAGAHRKTMPRLLEWCDEASLVDWSQDSAEPPSWPEAHRRLLHDGRRSRVNHPSEAQQRYDIPAPRLSGARS
jgi:hypothetical protein